MNKGNILPGSALLEASARAVQETAGLLVRGADGADSAAVERVDNMADEVAQAVRDGRITPAEVQRVIFGHGTRRERRAAMANFRKRNRK